MKDDGLQYAFPSSLPQPEVRWSTQGMTLRDYFAAKAMATLYANAELLDSSIASAAYRMADAMLEARK